MDETPIDISPHRRAWDALPWLVSGVASAAERELVERHLRDCEACRAELAFQQQLHQGFNALAPAELPSPEPGLQKLLARIEVAEAGLAPRGAPARWQRWLVAAVLVQAVGLGAAGLALWSQAEIRGDYRTLSQPVVVVTAATVRLVPAPDLPFGGLQALLAQAQMVVVETAADGSSLGLAPAAGSTLPLPQRLAALRADSRVRLAEPTGR